MAGVCSAHLGFEVGCFACSATPAMVLGITEAEWERAKVAAEKTGVAACQHCGFEQYKNHERCVKCGSGYW